MKKERFGPGSGLLMAAVFLLIGNACGGSSSTGNPFQEMVDQGVTQYEGLAQVSEETAVNGVIQYTYDPASGPRCLRGGTYHSAVRKTDSDELFIYLNGGGACWQEFCMAVTQAAVGIPDFQILDNKNPNNPLKDWNLSYLPYCDGSLFAGEAEYDDDGDGKIDRYHHGIRNLTAGLEVTRRNFPAPKRIFLAGSSAGGWGTIMATPLVRIFYPDVPIYIFSDSGSGVANGNDPGFLTMLLNEFNIMRFIPQSCQDCIANGHLTKVIAWALERDPKLKIGIFSSYQDKIYSMFFFGIPGAQFEAQLKEEFAYLNGEFPKRAKGFLIAGDMHTTLGLDVSVFMDNLGSTVSEDLITQIVTLGGLDTAQNGVTIAEWIRRMLYDESHWVNEIAQ